MLDPCKLCIRPECKDGTRKRDCLASFPRLRDIGNSPGGFGAAISTADWSEHEKNFYNQQIAYRIDVITELPDLL